MDKGEGARGRSGCCSGHFDPDMTDRSPLKSRNDKAWGQPLGITNGRLLNSLLVHNPHALTYPPQHLQRLLQFVLRVRGGHDGADAGFAFGHGGEGDAGTHHAFLEQLAGEVHGELAVPNDDWRDGRLAGGGGAAADVEAEQAEFFFPEAGVRPELFDALWFVFKNIEGRDAGGRDRGRMRSRKQERPGAVIKEVDQVV